MIKYARNTLIYLFWVSQKCLNIVLNPLKSHDLVHETLVTGYLRRVQTQEAKHAQPVVDGYNHNLIVYQEFWSILSAISS